jgi:hypothetical protein
MRIQEASTGPAAGRDGTNNARRSRRAGEAAGGGASGTAIVMRERTVLAGGCQWIIYDMRRYGVYGGRSSVDGQRSTVLTVHGLLSTVPTAWSLRLTVEGPKQQRQMLLCQDAEELRPFRWTVDRRP